MQESRLTLCWNSPSSHPVISLLSQLRVVPLRHCVGRRRVTREASSNMLSPIGNLCDQSRNAWHGFSWRGSSDWRTARAWSPGVRAPVIHNRSTDACSWTTDTSISSENATIGTKFADLYLTLFSAFHQWWRLRNRNDREPCINIIVTKKKRLSTLPFLWRSCWQRNLSILWWLLRSCASLKEMRHCPQWIVDLHCGNLIEMRELPLELFRLVVRRNVYRPCNKFHVHVNTLRNFQIVRTSKPSGFDHVVHFVVPRMWHFEKKRCALKIIEFVLQNSSLPIVVCWIYVAGIADVHAENVSGTCSAKRPNKLAEWHKHSPCWRDQAEKKKKSESWV